MKKIVFLVFIFLLACSDQSTNPDELYTISGIITQNGVPSSGANVSIDNSANLSTTTDDNGAFSISSVPKGNRSVNVLKTYANGGFVQKTSTINVNGDVEISSLTLPMPTHLYDVNNKTGNSATINWSPSLASDLREYKLYRHTSSGLDETTGTLIHISTVREDTSFVDKDLNSLTTYYYRVYIMNEFGKLGGSNIINVTTDNRNFISDGNFENISNLHATWLKSYYSGSAELDEDSFSGIYSLKLISDGHKAGVIYKDDLNLTSNVTYKLSGWFKSKGTYGSYDDFWGNPYTTYKTMLQIWINDNYNSEWSIGVEESDTTWTYIEKYFSIGEVKNAKAHLRTVCDFAWFDDLKLEIVEQ